MAHTSLVGMAVVIFAPKTWQDPKSLAQRSDGQESNKKRRYAETSNEFFKKRSSERMA